jgi:hypothetical protein
MNICFKNISSDLKNISSDRGKNSIRSSNSIIHFKYIKVLKLFKSTILIIQYLSKKRSSNKKNSSNLLKEKSEEKWHHQRKLNAL